MPTVEDLNIEQIDAGEAGEPEPPKFSPVVNPAKNLDTEDEDDDDEDIDESLAERLMGLTEMFPEGVRNLTAGVVGMSVGGTKWLYSVGRVGLWVAASSATILALPVMFETERSQMEEQQLAQQRQILLGPNAAVSGGGGPAGMMAPVPPPAR